MPDGCEFQTAGAATTIFVGHFTWVYMGYQVVPQQIFTSSYSSIVAVYEINNKTNHW